MTLPKITIPQFDITVPSIKTKLKFRPYLVKEEKVLLMAVESGADEDLVNACKQVIANCCLSDINIDNLTTFDMEYIFLKLKAQSVNNISKLAFIDKEDNKRYEFEVNLDEIEIKMPEEIDNKIKAGNVTIVMRYPTMAVAAALLEEDNEFKMLDKMVAGCIDHLYDDETVYNDYTQTELLAWLDQQPPEVYEQIRKFFESAPQLKHELKYTNSQGNERTIVLSGLPDFFTW